MLDGYHPQEESSFHSQCLFQTEIHEQDFRLQVLFMYAGFPAMRELI